MDFITQELCKNGYVIFELGSEYTNIVKKCSELTHQHVLTTNCTEYCKHELGICTKARQWNIVNIPEYRKLLSHPLIMSTVTNLYGKDNFHLTSFSTNTLAPNVCDIYWHVDHPYNKDEEYKENFPLSLQINISLDDFTEENGATMFVKNSHKMSKQEREIKQETDKTIFTCKKGTCLMYFGNLWHSAGKNKTKNLRSILLANFTVLKYDALKMKNPTDKQIYEQINKDDPDFKVENSRVLLKY